MKSEIIFGILILSLLWGCESRIAPGMGIQEAVDFEHLAFKLEGEQDGLTYIKLEPCANLDDIIVYYTDKDHNQIERFYSLEDTKRIVQKWRTITGKGG